MLRRSNILQLGIQATEWILDTAQVHQQKNGHKLQTSELTQN